MNLHLAKTGRLAALRSREADRVLVAPSRYESDLRLPDEGTAADYLVTALGVGVTVSQIMAETGWSKPTVMVNLYKVAKKTGIGIQRRNEKLHIVLPENAGSLYRRQKDITRREFRAAHTSGPVIPRFTMS
jgi:hypothetical protein